MERKVCFISDACNWVGGRGGWWVSVQRPTLPLLCWQEGGEGIFRQSWGWRWLSAEITQSSLTVILKLVISGLTRIILMVLGTVNLQFQVHLFISFHGLFLKLWQLKPWVQSGHHVVNFSTWGFSICKAAHRRWPRILATALENELKVLDYA